MADLNAVADVDAEQETDWYSNDAATFGDRVAAARDALGMSQADLAKRLGIKLKTLQGWEDDHGEPRANKLQMLSGVLNVSLTWLLNGEGEGLTEPETDAALDADITALLAELRQIKSALTQTGERLAAVEKRLRRAVRARNP
ncbi:putative DNA-binding protein [Candidatus Rhodobacter oscarellae]|uniref:Putative DNA-binding protein n=1 Tax=Candidatus Rhodobacter oscarellae TaxID=1675527 RepID=A0A0J9GS58_9RHOB|nr:helix-turn-helix domain-containing protein [Candidatus Rhodobacter lobularis]KMW56313.1 putative DNA-binding protein [Candidatus Rhodobacter lobularis]